MIVPMHKAVVKYPLGGAQFAHAAPLGSRVTVITREALVHGLLKDVLVHGAMPGNVLERIIEDGSSLRDWLVARGWMVRVPTPEGMAYVLGSRAKRRFGVRSTWITRPELAARQLLNRKVDIVLAQYRWQRTSGGLLPYPRYRRPDGRPVYLVAGRTGLRARTVSRILERCRAQLLREGAVLLVISSRWTQLRPLVTRSNGLLTVAALPLFLAPGGEAVL